jgi:prepilin-type N-terminal cleavage/methylation domain-containing protein
MVAPMRHAFSMIELIFTLVVLGIVFLTIPTIMQINSESLEDMQETKGLYHAYARAKLIGGKYWDENNSVESNGSLYYRVLSTQEDANNELNCTGRDESVRLRKGHYIGTQDTRYRRICAEEGFGATLPLNFNDGNFNDIDDFNEDKETLGGRFELNTSVSYVRYALDTTTTPNTIHANASLRPSQTSSIKVIQIEMRDGFMTFNNLSEHISTFHTFATNIGRVRLAEKINR